MLQAQSTRDDLPGPPSPDVAKRVADLLRDLTGSAAAADGPRRIHAYFGKHVLTQHAGSYEAWVSELERSDPASPAVALLVHRMVSGRTSFYSEPHHLVMLPRFLERVRRGAAGARIWSAGCASGEEAYSIVMCLASHYDIGVCKSIHVLATDVSTKRIESAKRGIYKNAALGKLPPDHRTRYTVAGSGRTEGYGKVRGPIQAAVHFAVANLVGQAPLEEPVDALFCRDVLPGLAEEAREAVIDTLVASVRSGGILMLGKQDAGLFKRPGVYPVGPGTYSKR